MNPDNTHTNGGAPLPQQNPRRQLEGEVRRLMQETATGPLDALALLSDALHVLKDAQQAGIDGLDFPAWIYGIAEGGTAGSNVQQPEAAEQYQHLLMSGTPLYATRLVRQGEIPYAARHETAGPAALAAVLQRFYDDKDREEVVVCLLDAAATLVGIVPVHTGGLACCMVEPAQVFKAAILSGAAEVVVAHNHLTGRLEPSRHDVEMTRQLVEAGRAVGVPVRDHLIIGQGGYASLAEMGHTA